MYDGESRRSGVALPPPLLVARRHPSLPPRLLPLLKNSAIDRENFFETAGGFSRRSFASVPLPHVHEVPRDRGRGRHRRRNQVRAPAHALPALEIAV
jgi:hypothetical protein